MDYAITTVTVAPRPTAVLTATTTWDEYPRLWRRLLDEVHAGVVWLGDGPKGRNVMFYKDDLPRVEVGVELDQPAELGGRVTRSALPAGEVAMTVHRGSYDALGSAHDAVRRWCTGHGRVPVGPRWEIYGHWHNDPSTVKTEIYYLLR
jgi:effector-binding domain-containing protein